MNDEDESITRREFLSAIKELKGDLKWYVAASVGLNQVFNNVQVASLASAGLVGVAACVKGILWLRG